MDIRFAIRAGIFLAAGLIVILFHTKVNGFQNHVLKMFHFKTRIKNERKAYVNIGIVFFFIAVILFVYSIIN